MKLWERVDGSKILKVVRKWRNQHWKLNGGSWRDIGLLTICCYSSVHSKFAPRFFFELSQLLVYCLFRQIFGPKVIQRPRTFFLFCFLIQPYVVKRAEISRYLQLIKIACFVFFKRSKKLYLSYLPLRQYTIPDS